MPDLSGLTVANARSLILSSGLKFGSSASTNTSTSSQNGNVAAQAVAPGTLVDYETSISIQYYNYVAPPPTEPTAPYIVGVAYGSIQAYSQTTTEGSCGVNGNQYAFNEYTLTSYRALVYDTYSNGSQVARSPAEYNYDYPSEQTLSGTKTNVVGKCGYSGSTTSCSNYNTSCSGNTYQTRQKCVNSSTGATISDTLVSTSACGCSSSTGGCSSNGFRTTTTTCYNPDGSTYSTSSSSSCQSCGSSQTGSCSGGQIATSRTCVEGGIAYTSTTYASCCTPSQTARYYFACSGGSRAWTQVTTYSDCSEVRTGGSDPCCSGGCGSWTRTATSAYSYTETRTCLDANCNTFTDSRSGCIAHCGDWRNSGSCTSSPYGRYQNQVRTCVNSSCGTYSESRSISC